MAIQDCLEAACDSVQSSATSAASSASSAASSAASASDSADEAAASAALATIAGNYEGTYASGTTYTVGDSVEYEGNIYIAKRTTVGDTPDVSTADWTYVPYNPAMSVGNISNPLLDLPLQNSLAMKTGVGSVTFTRSTTGTYIDRYGGLQTASINEPRFEKEGLLIEGASTNLISHSEAFEDSAWVSLVTVADNTAVSPIGDTTATTITSTAIGHVFQLLTVTSGALCTASIFSKKGTAERHLISVYDHTNSAWIVVAQEVPSNAETWTRYSLPFTVPAACTEVRFYVADVDAATEFGTLFIYGAQIEELPFASSYIPTTTTAVTRSAETLTVDFNGNFTGWQEEASYVMDIKPLGITGDNQMILHDGVSNGNGYINYSNTGSVNCLMGGSTVCGLGALDISTFNRILFTQDKTNIKGYLNGEQKDSDPSTATVVTNPSTMYICSKSGDVYYGHILNFKTYPFVLSTVEARMA